MDTERKSVTIGITVVFFVLVALTAVLNILKSKAEIEQRDYKISGIDNKIAKLQVDITSKDDSIKSKSLVIAEKENEMNKAWIVAGTSDQLEKKGFITKYGGFLGIAKNININDNLNGIGFTKLDIRNTFQYPLNTKKAKLISQHPDNSYRLVEENDNIAYLEIENPEEFWKLTKYVIIETK